jgi:dTDP-glucose pyrophosphorylase
MKPVQILMPMGGLGQRFRDAGWTTPKPLIEVEGRPMFQKALSSFDDYPGEKVTIFVVRQDAEDEYGLATDIKKMLPDAKISLLRENTRGAVESCLLAREHINPELPLVVMDCDIHFTSADYLTKLADMTSESRYDGLLLSFESADPRYSFARVDEQGNVVETAEKRAISNHALIGSYTFGSGKLFLDAAAELMKRPISEDMKEYYISYLYNLLLAEGKKVGLAKAEVFNSMGTPEELESYLNKVS